MQLTSALLNAVVHIWKAQTMTLVDFETQNWLSMLSFEDVSRAVDYTQGNHWISLVQLIITLAACFVISRLPLFRWAVERPLRYKHRQKLSAFSAALVFFAVLALMTLPFSVLFDWHRERVFDLSRQPFLDWASQWFLISGLTTLFSAVLVMCVYLLIRRTGQFWWIWASALAASSLLLVTVLAPALIAPRLNTFTPAPPGDVLSAVTELAASAGIPDDRIYIYDGSRQSDRFTANVSGLFSTSRIALSDTMFQQGADIAEIRAVVAHELGHYVKHHVLLTLAFYSGLAGLVFLLTDRIFRTIAHRRIGGLDHMIQDPSSLPLMYAIFTTLIFLATPVTNTYSRLLENTADVYALQLSDEPDGLANALIKTANYRAPSPHLLEEMLFYSHPSVERRIRRAMVWKIENR
jgi:STE24 endopeptidase